MNVPAGNPAHAGKLAAAVLLVTPADLNSDGIGALFLRDLMASQPDISFTVHEVTPYLMGGGRTSGRRLRRISQAAASRLRWYHSVRLRLFKTKALPGRVATVRADAARAKAGCIWITASSPEAIWIGAGLVASGMDVRVTVWDAPEYLSGNLRLDAGLRGELMQAFASLLRGAHAVSVIGTAMQTDYRRQYGIESEIIRHGIDATSLPPANRGGGRDGAVRIIFAGSLYSKQEWNSFIQALDVAQWQIENRPVILHFMGRFPLSGAVKPNRLVLLGEKPFSDALEIMSGMDIGYLPYWFDESHSVVARTSFPGKLTAYAAAGLAVFHHAPAYTEATQFLQTHPFGLACPSLEPEAVLETLSRLVAFAQTDQCRQARETAFRNELSRDAMGLRVQRFLARVQPHSDLHGISGGSSF